VQGAPELDAGLQVGSQQRGAEEQNPLPRPAGHAACDAAQHTAGLLVARVQLFIHQCSSNAPTAEGSKKVKLTESKTRLPPRPHALLLLTHPASGWVTPVLQVTATNTLGWDKKGKKHPCTTLPSYKEVTLVKLLGEIQFVYHVCSHNKTVLIGSFVLSFLPFSAYSFFTVHMKK